jgi:hypothetical protein
LQHVAYSTMRKAFNNARHACLFDDQFVTHTLRHSFATHLLEQPRWLTCRLSFTAASLHHKSRTGRRLREDGTDAGETFRRSIDAWGVYARRVGGSNCGNCGVAKAAYGFTDVSMNPTACRWTSIDPKPASCKPTRPPRDCATSNSPLGEICQFPRQSLAASRHRPVRGTASSPIWAELVWRRKLRRHWPDTQTSGLRWEHIRTRTCAIN